MSPMPSQRSFLMSTLQHTQPPASSSTSPPPPMMSWVSIEIRPSSLTSTAIRLPCVAASMRFSAVVFPAPSHPVRMVNGTFRSASEEDALDDIGQHLAHERTDHECLGP